MIVKASADPTADLLLQLAMSSSMAVSDEVRSVLRKRLSAAFRARKSVAELVDIARRTLLEYVQPFADILADARLAAWLGGGGTISGALPPSIDPPHVGRDSFDWDGNRNWLPLIAAAAQDLRDRGLLFKGDYARASEAVRKDSFTVAQQASLAALEGIRGALVDAVEKGTGLPDFRHAVDDISEVSPIGAGHLENVFRTNVQQAYSAGMDKILDHPQVVDLWPFEETIPIDDSRLTELCEKVTESGLDGTNIYYRDDPEWQRLKPPRHFGCRCSRKPVSVEEAAERGVRYAQEWLRAGEQPLYKPMPRVPVELPKGWTPGGKLVA